MNKSSKSYAKSLFERLISENKIEENINSLREDLLLFSAIIESSKESFGDPFLAEEYKYQTLVNLFPKMTKTSHSLLKILLEKRQIHLLPEIYLDFEKFAKKYFKIKNVKIITSAFLDKNLSKDLLEKLKKLCKAKEIILEIEYKEELLSGFIIESSSAALDESSFQEFKALLKEI